ncbi:dihydrofolate synthase/folylpolyglutamate synthase [Theileria orientalis strain Shintoku]|uniref:Dihydrofolate synthase/folylpolyglutamate synthase n=1 Tax=Theileria orientalis strain Shintoku TaxID=869250 RepID=J4D5F3_THEOR|nr:dihydrofolate synthase/folylpolyglutamate synthase [Theileria orientalis strain Shintoku]PVC53513.1 dihydrofolate synthase/folylpolyglutamate synthase [Theileria orientalis]BAM38925.1 dihydrofolate synthase/folylpolyglutamate synthase [Theileria orientalis strain Shintoku]|eukprot:XP_009689226.1 dihydrofolate synthase/folylpolyglutamate synthase [Theileria orientalis strain Shintoku]
MEDEIENQFRRTIDDIMARSKKNDKFVECLDLLAFKRDQFNVIHVSGTNGKSSVSYKVAQCLISLGKTVGLFTSPHLFEYNERIRVQGVDIPKADFIRISNKINTVIGSTSIHFFSYILLLSLVYFDEKGVEWVVLETGIGGLKDSTNFASNTKIAVITSIGYDHMHILGNTLEEIALQKAATIKRGCVVVLGPNCYKSEIFENIAREVGAKVIKNNGRDFGSFDEENSETSRLVIEQALKIGKASKSALNARLMMRMQVLSADECEGVKRHIFAKFPGLRDKMDKYGAPMAVVMDIGHNETAISRLCSDIFKAYKCNITFCCAISERRKLRIFNPIESVQGTNALGQPSVRKFYYLNVDHSYCRRLESVENDLNDPELSNGAREIIKLGLERSRMICSGVTNCNINKDWDNCGNSCNDYSETNHYDGISSNNGNNDNCGYTEWIKESDCVTGNS